MVFRKCVHCNREYEDVFNRRICSTECGITISWSLQLLKQILMNALRILSMFIITLLLKVLDCINLDASWMDLSHTSSRCFTMIKLIEKLWLYEPVCRNCKMLCNIFKIPKELLFIFHCFWYKYTDNLKFNNSLLWLEQSSPLPPESYDLKRKPNGILHGLQFHFF